MKIGIVGTGYWNHLALEAAKNLPEIHIDRIWSRTPKRADVIATELSVLSGKPCRPMKDQSDLNGLDFVIVALPPSPARSVLQQAIERKLPAIVEKPLSLNTFEISELRKKANAAGVPIAVNMQARFLPEMHSLRSLVLSKKYGLLREVDVHILGNAGGYAAPAVHSWLHILEDGDGVRGISGPHAAEFVLALAGAGSPKFSKAWIEVKERNNSGGSKQTCTADDNALVISEHTGGPLSTIRIGTTSRKAEEVWSARCDDGTLRYTSDSRLVLLDNFGKTAELPSGREEVLKSVGLQDVAGLQNCSSKSFPSLVLLSLFSRKVRGREASLPDLKLLEDCMALLAVNIKDEPTNSESRC